MQAQERIRVLLADDHVVVRKGTRLIIESEPDMRVVGEVGDGDEMLRLVDQIGFDVALVDVSMPRMNGLSAAKLLKQRHPQCRVLILTGYTNPIYITSARENGIDGFMLKERSPLELLTAIRMLMLGHQIFPPQRYGAAGQTANLTEREQEIIKLVAAGLSNKAIAAKLFITERTVEYHLSNLYGKLGAVSRAEAVKRASDLGLLLDI